MEGIEKGAAMLADSHVFELAPVTLMCVGSKQRRSVGLGSIRQPTCYNFLVCRLPPPTLIHGNLFIFTRG